jgi:hypothetical protein
MRDDQLLASIVSCHARKAARIAWWADLRDLQGEAWVAALEADASYDPAVGRVSRSTWVQCAVDHHLREWVRQTSSPARLRRAGSGPIPRRAELPRETESAEAAMALALLPPALVDARTPEELLCEARGRAAARREVPAALQAADPAGLAAQVLLAGQKPASVSKDRRVPVQQVYAATAKAKALLRRNRILRQAYQEAA